MTNIVVLIKQVPDTWSERKLSESDWTLDREAADAVLDEINERAVEEALLIKEKEAANGVEGTVTVLTAGPQRATEAIRKALSMGADKAVHLVDEGIVELDADGTIVFANRSAAGALDESERRELTSVAELCAVLERDFRLEQLAAVDSPIGRVGVGKMPADIALCQCPVNRIRQGVHAHIGVGMAVQPLGVRDLHPAQDQPAGRCTADSRS